MIFHKKLNQRINYLKSKFGVVYLIDIHSTPTLSKDKIIFQMLLLETTLEKVVKKVSRTI